MQPLFEEKSKNSHFLAENVSRSLSENNKNSFFLADKIKDLAVEMEKRVVNLMIHAELTEVAGSRFT